MNQDFTIFLFKYLLTGEGILSSLLGSGLLRMEAVEQVERASSEEMTDSEDVEPMEPEPMELAEEPCRFRLREAFSDLRTRGRV